MTRLLILLSIMLTFLCTNAEARSDRHHSQHRHHHFHRHHHHAHQPKVQAQPALFSWFQPAQFQSIQHSPVYKHYKEKVVKSPSNFAHQALAYSSQIISHPIGCPPRAYCGCGASIEAFGHSVRSLWLAANWFKFRRTPPSEGMAMVRPHHVAILKQHIQGSLWLVVDHNSGKHLSRIHVRDIRGYTIVNPHGR
jgi:hypothetical protein